MPVEMKSTETRQEESVRELLGFFLALADQSRLKIVGLLSQEDHTVEQLAALVGLRASTVSHHLARLADAGLVSARAEGHYSVYSLDTQVVRVMARRLLKPEGLSQLAHGVDRGTFDEKVLATFTGPDGRFTAFPAQEKKFRVLLRHVLQDFEPGVRYTEKKVNAILSRYSDDTALLRRNLVDFGFMEREGGGRDYWRKESVAQ